MVFTLSDIMQLKLFFFLSLYVMMTDFYRVMYIAATPLAIIFN